MMPLSGLWKQWVTECSWSVYSSWQYTFYCLISSLNWIPSWLGKFGYVGFSKLSPYQEILVKNWIKVKYELPFIQISNLLWVCLFPSTFTRKHMEEEGRKRTFKWTAPEELFTYISVSSVVHLVSCFFFLKPINTLGKDEEERNHTVVDSVWFWHFIARRDGTCKKASWTSELFVWPYDPRWKTCVTLQSVWLGRHTLDRSCRASWVFQHPSYSWLSS